MTTTQATIEMKAASAKLPQLWRFVGEFHRDGRYFGHIFRTDDNDYVIATPRPHGSRGDVTHISVERYAADRFVRTGGLQVSASQTVRHFDIR